MSPLLIVLIVLAAIVVVVVGLVYFSYCYDKKILEIQRRELRLKFKIARKNGTSWTDCFRAAKREIYYWDSVAFAAQENGIGPKELITEGLKTEFPRDQVFRTARELGMKIQDVIRCFSVIYSATNREYDESKAENYGGVIHDLKDAGWSDRDIWSILKDINVEKGFDFREI